MHFSWAVDLNPKGANNQIKEAVDKRYLPDDDDIGIDDADLVGGAVEGAGGDGSLDNEDLQWKCLLSHFSQMIKAGNQLLMNGWSLEYGEKYKNTWESLWLMIREWRENGEVLADSIKMWSNKWNKAERRGTDFVRESFSAEFDAKGFDPKFLSVFLHPMVLFRSLLVMFNDKWYHAFDGTRRILSTNLSMVWNFTLISQVEFMYGAKISNYVMESRKG